MSGAYDPLQYPLLFPYGEYGWHDNILRANVINPEEYENTEDLMEVNEEIGEYSGIRHTGATQEMEELFIGLESSSKDKGKEKATEVEFDNDEDAEESEHEEIQEIQQEITKRKRVTIREFVVYRIQIRDSNKTKSILHLSK